VDNLQTLSTRNADLDGTISGFLYVPDLSKDDTCYNISQEYVPANVTRQANLPPTDFTLVAIAPWISVNCTFSYIAAASLDPARAFIFYQPNVTDNETPASDSSAWDLQDGGAWKTRYQSPVYAIPGAIGYELMHELALYSGNMTDVPFGHTISEFPGVDASDYVRLYTELDVAAATTLPSLWVFLLVIFGVLLLILGSISASMHLIQRARRKSLRRRVAQGEVNLEALGIKRLTVPQVFIDRLPLFTYSAEPEPTPPPSPQKKAPSVTETSNVVESSSEDPVPVLSPIGKTQLGHMMLVNDKNSNRESILVHKFLPYSQPTCAICLEDYVSGETEIRELPCGHIFHPDCIDTFLGNNSSLCPMCKKSVLPIGFCPTKITNTMVRRERNLRRLRSRVTILEENVNDMEADGARARVQALRAKFKRPIHASSAPREVPSLPLQPQPIYMTNALPPLSGALHTQPLNLSPSPREQIVAQRIEELASAQAPIEDPDVATERQRPMCKFLLVLFCFEGY